MARKRIDRAFLEHAGTIVDRQIRASLTLEQTLRYKGIIVKTPIRMKFFAGSEKLPIAHVQIPSRHPPNPEKRRESMRFGFILDLMALLLVVTGLSMRQNLSGAVMTIMIRIARRNTTSNTSIIGGWRKAALYTSGLFEIPQKQRYHSRSKLLLLQ